MENKVVCSKHKIPFHFKCPMCENERIEKIKTSADKAFKIYDKALKKLSEN